MTYRDEAVCGVVVALATVDTDGLIVDSALNGVAFVVLTVKHTKKDLKQEPVCYLRLFRLCDNIPNLIFVFKFLYHLHSPKKI